MKAIIEQPSTATNSRSLIKRLVKTYLTPYYSTLSVSVVLMVIAAAMTGAMAKLMEPVIDDVFTAQDQSMLWPVAIAVFLTFAVRGIATYFHSILLSKVSQRIVADIQNDLFSHIMSLDMSFFQEFKTGQLLSRMTSDATVMRSSVTETLLGVFKNSITLVILVGVMFYQDWKLALIALVIFPLVAGFVVKLGRKLRRVSTSAQSELGDLATDLTQAFQGVRHVKAYGMIDHEKSRINNIVERIFKLTYKGLRVSALTTPISEILSGLAIVTIIVYGGYQVIDGESTAGQLFSFITAFMLAYEPMKRLAKLNTIMQVGLSAADRIFTVLDTQSQIKDYKDSKEMKGDGYNITLENISFAYPDGTEALRDVTIEVPEGKTVALVGPSGSGKSTIINLIPRFYEVEKGAIKIGDTDIRDITLKSLRKNMALVSQEVTIFNDTILDNIRYGTPDATVEDVMKAAKDAAAHEFIEGMPDGYNTIVGEQGIKLSGGQRQRVAIARAMLRNAPILLMDEATSALDNQSERLVQNALDRLQKGRTTLVVAHRLSTIINADMIYVLKDGEVVEQGKHQKLLLKKKGVYSKLYGVEFQEI